MLSLSHTLGKRMHAYPPVFVLCVLGVHTPLLMYNLFVGLNKSENNT